MQHLSALILTAALAGCATTTDPAQRLYSATLASIRAVDQATIAADAAVRSGALKGQDAQNALQGIVTARAGLGIANAIAAGSAASAASAGATK